MPKPTFFSYPDKPLLADALADRFLTLIHGLLQNKEEIHISLTGGSMGVAILAASAQKTLLEKIDWSRVHFWWSDERFVPAGHADRNEQEAKDALLDSLAIPAGNIHVMGASDTFDTAEDAARDYQVELSRFASGAAAYPVFDVTLLGLGPDGHIASLFPDRDEILAQEEITLPIHQSPKPPADRVTLTLPVICASERIWFMVAGADKNEALTRLHSARNLEISELTQQILQQTPAAGARGISETLVFTDQAAQGELNF